MGLMWTCVCEGGVHIASMCIHTCVLCVCIGDCKCLWRPEVDLQCHSLGMDHFFFFSRQNLTLTGHWQAGWAEWLVSYIDSLLSPSLVHHHTWVFCVSSVDQAQVLMLAKQDFTNWAIAPFLKDVFLKSTFLCFIISSFHFIMHYTGIAALHMVFILYQVWGEIRSWFTVYRKKGADLQQMLCHFV